MKRISPKVLAMLVAAIGILVVGAPTVSAQRGRMDYNLRQSSHFYLGIEGTVFGILKQVTDQAGYMGHGGGGAVVAGYRIAPFLSIEGNLGITYHSESLGRYGQFVVLDSLFLATVMADVKIHFTGKRRFEPFIQVGLGYAYLGAAYDDSYCGSFACDTTFAQGPAFEVGGGFDYWFSRWISVGARLLYRIIYFSEANYGDVTVRNNNGNFINGISLGVNVAFHLF